ncbi:MAG: Asp-tRNA(Asn)/Glu-tRNA(Gln) amidotransferase A subunit family amidase [Cyclobacteriaceae bacterium]|jgi:Asp-tRNA(Asn)/Glu-tRNA(Gln) amidotransferase A subunit family amidase
MKNYLLLLFSILYTNTSFAQVDSLAEGAKIFGIAFEQDELDSLRESTTEFLDAYKSIRAHKLTNNVPFSMMFQFPVNESKIQEKGSVSVWDFEKVKMPKNKDDLAFYTVSQLSVLIKNKKLTSEELTMIFLDRLKKYSDTLECTILVLEERAIAQAKNADRLYAAGTYLGPLHGIPFGVKDLLALEGYPTTWGAVPYKNQELNYTASVIDKLEAAGGVLIAKLTLGALAWGDVWYGGKTRNPWNLSEGSSGSSAGSASATSAGLVPFAIGSETWGSIVSPSTRCGTTGLRPTYGRISKFGAMALSWSMDKLGPITRSAQDCAIVFDAIYGPDDRDLQTVDYPFAYEAKRNVKSMKVGYIKSLFDSKNGFNFKNDSAVLTKLQSSGIQLVPVELPNEIDPNALSFILTAEAAAAFDELTLSNQDDALTRQIKNAWPNVFRSGRFIPAVEYIQANRLRYLLVQQLNEVMKDFDVIITPSFGGTQMLMTNLTGHPCLVLPNGSYAKETPGSITLLGNHFDEASILRFGEYLQSITDYHKEHPVMFKQ